jgi:hypothetical protein
MKAEHTSKWPAIIAIGVYANWTVIGRTEETNAAGTAGHSS